MAGREAGVIEEQDVQENGGGTAVAHRPGSTGAELQLRSEVGGLMRPVAAPDEVLAAQEAIRNMVETALVAGRDYDTIPGTGKPTLLKPGAERIQMAFGAYSDFEIVEQEVDHDREVHYQKEKWLEVDKPSDEAEIEAKKASGRGRFRKGSNNAWIWQEKDVENGLSYGLYRYVIRCNLVNRKTGVIIGSGIGVCSTMESKYIDRPRDLENTAAKMAKKRAQIDAVLSTFGLSEMFTQDLDDMSGGPTSTNGGGSSSSPGFTGNAGSSSGPSVPNGGPAFLDSKISDLMSKPKKEVAELTWREAIAKQKGYVEWVVENYRNISDQQRSTLAAAMDPQKNSGPGSVHDNGGGEEKEEEPRIQKEQIVELRNLAKELEAVEATERFIARNPTLKKAALQIANAKKHLAAKREQEAASEKEEAAAAGQPHDDEGGEEQSGSLFDPDDDLPFD